MKIKYMLLTIFAVALLINTSESYSKGQQHSISANPIGLLGGFINATYEQALDSKNSFTIFGYLYSKNDWTGLGVGGSYRWYLVGKSLEGLSAGPLALISTWSWDGGGIYNYDGGLALSVGGELAYKWIFDSFVVEPQINVTFTLIEIDGLSYPGVGWGVNLGYAW